MRAFRALRVVRALAWGDASAYNATQPTSTMHRILQERTNNFQEFQLYFLQCILGYKMYFLSHVVFTIYEALPSKRPSRNLWLEN